MENSCLNLAHFYGRKADKHLRYRRYDEAIASHQKAADLLDEAITKTTVSKSIESLQLQRDQHLKYKDLVLMKKDHFDKYTRALEQQKQKNAEAMEQMAKDRIENSCQLQLAIYKTMEDTDSLLEVLCNKASSSDSSSKVSDGQNCDVAKPIDDATTIKHGIKKPKDDSTVIEELRTLNHQLHILIFQLVSQLDEVNQESESLREKVKQLERTRTVQSVLPLIRANNIYGETCQSLNILTDSVDETVLCQVAPAQLSSPLSPSPSICSSSSSSSSTSLKLSSGNRSPDTVGTQEFPPLELPTFDFTTFECKK